MLIVAHEVQHHAADKVAPRAALARVPHHDPELVLGALAVLQSQVAPRVVRLVIGAAHRVVVLGVARLGASLKTVH